MTADIALGEFALIYFFGGIVLGAILGANMKLRAAPPSDAVTRTEFDELHEAVRAVAQVVRALNDEVFDDGPALHVKPDKKPDKKKTGKQRANTTKQRANSHGVTNGVALKARGYSGKNRTTKNGLEKRQN